MKKRIFSIFTALALCLTLLPAPALAADTTHNISQSTLTISQNGSYTVTGTTTANRIIVQSGVTAAITLSGVSITAPTGQPAIDVASGASLTLILASGTTNTLTGGSSTASLGAPGIHVPSGASLTIQGSGTLTVTGGSSQVAHAGPGIGGNSAEAIGTAEACGTVMILDGTVNVTGGTSGTAGYSAGAVGIGGGNKYGGGGAGGTVLILGGTVTVKGGTVGGSTATDIGGGSGAGNGAGIKPDGSGGYVVYGSLTLPADITLPAGAAITISSGASLTVPTGTTLTIPAGTTLTNNGTITNNGAVTNNGAINNSGTLTTTNGTVSGSGTLTGSGTVNKKAQTAVPSAPTLSGSATATTVTLNAVTDNSGVGGIEYGYTTGTGTTPGSWQTGTSFTSLSPGTKYTFYARYAGSDYIAPSSPSRTGVTVYTLPSITTNALTAATVGVAYSATLVATAGETVTWSLTDGSLPDGLSLDSNGTISGTPTTASTSPMTFTVQASVGSGNDAATSTQQLSITVNKDGASLSLNTYKDETQTDTFTYGDTIKVTGTVTASSQASGISLLTLAEPEQNQAALFLGDTQLTQPVNVDDNGTFTITYDTAGKGITPSGSAQTLTVKYGGSSSLNEGSATVSITLQPKAVTAEVTNTVTKAYDGATSATVTLAVNSNNLVNSTDSVTVTGTGTYASAGVGNNIAVTVSDIQTSGNDVAFYKVSAPANVTGAITVAAITNQPQISGEAVYGQTLTAAYTPATGETVALQWNRGGQAISGATETTYTVAAADVGCAITVTATATDGNHTGSVTSQSVTAGKAGQAAPSAAPELDSRTTNSITLKKIEANGNGAAAEYGISTDGGETWTWQDSPVFTKLSSGTEYTFALRYSATEDGGYATSPASETAAFSTTRPSYPTAPTYTPTVEKTDNGSASVSPAAPKQGDEVIITPKPDKSYEVDSVTVTDRNGKTVKVTDNGDGTYSFIQPAGKVTVEVAFREIEQPAEGLPFTDVAKSAYYYDAVAWAVANGVAEGATATTFSPDAPCTRSQAVTFLWRAAGSPAPKSNVNPFTDVKLGAYYYDAVLWAVENGITVGTSSTTFSPDVTSSRAQIVTFLYRAKGTATADSNPFADVADNTYYYDAVLWAVKNGVTVGTSATTFSPDNDCTRAQIVTFLYRAYM